MKEIQLTKGKVALVDDEDFEYLNQWKWQACQKRNNKYYVGRTDYKVKGKKNRIWMHRLIMKPFENFIIDHIDGNGLNNQKNNLRICTHSQNLMNRCKNINNTSGYKGVVYNKLDKKYRAKIYFNSKCISLGRYINPIDAARAYNQAAQKYHGEYAQLNVIPKENLLNL